MGQNSGSISIPATHVIRGLDYNFRGEFEEEDLFLLQLNIFGIGLFDSGDGTYIDLPSRESIFSKY